MIKLNEAKSLEDLTVIYDQFLKTEELEALSADELRYELVDELEDQTGLRWYSDKATIMVEHAKRFSQIYFLEAFIIAWERIEDQ